MLSWMAYTHTCVGSAEWTEMKKIKANKHELKHEVERNDREKRGIESEGMGGEADLNMQCPCVKF